jgi:hypothetical protein
VKTLRVQTLTSLSTLLVATLLACDGGGAGNASRGTGGRGEAGGASSTGGPSASGGSTGAGGDWGAGGSKTGGTTSTGGSITTGGTTSAGGTVSSGGTPSSGGARTGGATSTGNATSSGGTRTGGATSSGGTISAGGARTGGTASTGGVVSTGGSVASGGVATGGATAIGGTTTPGTGPLCSGSGEYTWPPYSPTVAYDYKDEYGEIAKPTKDSNDVTGIAGRYTKDWWTFVYGSKKNSLVTEAAWVPMLERFNADFAYITDEMRWPRDGRARAGYFSAVYLYGSGLSTDTASNTATGGWQSSAANGPMVLASYYPVYSFDPACTYNDKASQQSAMIHEGIHCILSTMPGCQKSCWFNEAGNTWLQANMEIKRSGKAPTSMGFLSAAAALAPFMPIECYSGWLQDGSFGGPCAQNVEKTNSSGQKISTWRNLLGGTQYGESFAHALGVMLGDKAMAWIFRYANKSGLVLQDLAEVTTPSPGIGPVQTRRLIQEFRARQAFGDFGVWTAAYKALLNGAWNTSIEEERVEAGILQDVEPWIATPYVKTSKSGTTLTPDEQTLPGWSGANQIPLTIATGASCVTVDFKPTGANMSCQLVYQDSSGKVHYGAPVSSGSCSIPVSNVKNSVVIAVLSNTDYIFDGGKKKYGYTLDIGEGVSGTADINKQWYK